MVLLVLLVQLAVLVVVVQLIMELLVVQEIHHQHHHHKEIMAEHQRPIHTLVEVEEEELQNYVRKNGTTYETTGHNGQLYSKQRPEWQQLRDNRQRKTAIVKSLEAKMNQEMEEDELDKFLE